MTATVEAAALSERRMVAAGLRLSARLAGPAEAALAGAAVELAARAYGGEFVDPGWPWVVEGRPEDLFGLFWLDPDAMAGWDGGRPAHPVMAFVEALAGGRPVRRLAELLGVLDASTRRLVVTAFHHAARGRRDVAVYACGGDPSLLVEGGRGLRFWPLCDLDVVDRPTVALRPRLRAAGGAW